jgi:CheY-like chemotaxis protein
VASSKESHRQAEEIINDPGLMSVWDSNPLESQLIVALVEAGILTKFQIKKLAKKRKEGECLLDTFLGTGTITEEDIAEGLADHYHLPYMRLTNLSIESELFNYVEEDLARRHLCVPLRIERKQLTVAMHNPLDFKPIHKIESEKGLSVKAVISSRSDILRVVEEQYGMSATLDKSMKGACKSDELPEGPQSHEHPNQPVPTGPDELGETIIPDGRVRVLIIEDEAMVRKLIHRFLRRLKINTEVDFAENGLEGLTKVRERAPHLILLDLHMPTMDGIQFLQHLREDPKTASIPVVVMTSQSPQQSQQVAMDLGAHAYLSKPIKPQEFETNLRSILSRIYGL